MPKFNAAEWKEAIETDIKELKNFAISVNNYLSLIEQWRKLPFNLNSGENNETNSRRNQEDARKAKGKKGYGPTGSNPKSKKRNSGNMARKSRAKTKKLKR